MKRPGLLLLLPVLWTAAATAQEEYTFDISEFEKKPFELGGYVELRQERLWLDRDAALYKLNFFDKEQRRTLDRTTGTLELAGKYQRGVAVLNFRTHSSFRRDQLESDNVNRLYEGFLSLRPDPRFTLDLGKQTLWWGKGYAFNPVGFLQRPKDPLEPELAREGFTMITADWIHSFDGPLKTLTFSPVLLPVSSALNRDFGEPDHLNPAARVYLLYRDIDIDLVYLGRGSRTPRFGVDFAYNMRTDLAIHGEWAYIRDARTGIVDAAGNVTTREENVQSYLLGLRYLSPRETTYIVEYYRNGLGRSEAEMRDFFAFIDHGLAQFSATGSDVLLQRAASLSRTGYGGFAPMRRYLYTRVSQKEPFDILYFVPAITAIVNLDDRSYNLTPELLYTGVTNLDLRLRVGLLGGGTGTEYGEKQNERRIELMLRYYF